MIKLYAFATATIMTETKDNSKDNSSIKTETLVYCNPHHFISRDISMCFCDINSFKKYSEFAHNYFKNHPEATSVCCNETGGYNAVKRICEKDELVEGTIRHIKYVIIDWKY